MVQFLRHKLEASLKPAGGKPHGTNTTSWKEYLVQDPISRYPSLSFLSIVFEILVVLDVHKDVIKMLKVFFSFLVSFLFGVFSFWCIFFLVYFLFCIFLLLLMFRCCS